MAVIGGSWRYLRRYSALTIFSLSAISISVCSCCLDWLSSSLEISDSLRWICLIVSLYFYVMTLANFCNFSRCSSRLFWRADSISFDCSKFFSLSKISSLFCSSKRLSLAFLNDSRTSMFDALILGIFLGSNVTLGTPFGGDGLLFFSPLASLSTSTFLIFEFFAVKLRWPSSSIVDPWFS